MPTAIFAASTESRRHGLKAVLFAGLAAGLLDAVYFSVKASIEGNTPLRVLQAIGSFWLGRPAFTDPVFAPALGLGTHFALAIGMAAGFALLQPRVPLFARSTIKGGATYGVLLFVTMYLIVLPARWPSLYPRFEGAGSVADVAMHMLLGIVIARILDQRRS